MKAEFFLDTDVAELKELEKALFGFAESDVPLSVEVIVTDEEEIRRLNREFRKIDKVTDVLSFPSMDDVKGSVLRADEHAEELDEENRLFLGSIVICKTRAEEQAEEYGHSFLRELCYLTVHGILHCLGYDHETEEEKTEMREKEEEILKKAGLSRE